MDLGQGMLVPFHPVTGVSFDRLEAPVPEVIRDDAGVMRLGTGRAEDRDVTWPWRHATEPHARRPQPGLYRRHIRATFALLDPWA